VDLPHEPMRLAVRREAFTHPDWIFEIKYDGFRSLARIAGGQAELISRRRNVYKSFVGLRAGLKHALAAHTALLDGKIVCLDPGRPSSVLRPVVLQIHLCAPKPPRPASADPSRCHRNSD
jgi:hypothetical protein